MRADFDAYIREHTTLRKKIAADFFSALKKRSAKSWKAVSRVERMSVFKEAVKSVPAYLKFLKAHNVRPSSIKSEDDFHSLPPMTKANYLRAFPLTERTVKNRTSDTAPIVFTATSGSTGEPVYFPRNHILDLQSSMYHELIFRNAKISQGDPTLVVVAFGMGVWIGGIITYEAIKTMGERGYNVSVITPGSNKAEIFAALKHIGKNYKHVVICGYPPFIKDLVDEGPAEGVRWKTFKSLKFVCAAEMFTEKFRDYLMKKTGIKNPLRDIANIYGSADLGTMAIETPLAILIRRLALKNRRVYKRLFTDANRLPTVAQFHPDFISFEAAGRSLFLTGYNSVPLIRYEIGDHGGVFDFRDAEKVFAIEGINLKAEAKKAGISDSVAELPFVYVYERSDLSTKLYGAIIWPEHVREALMEKGLQKEITGRFTLITKHDGNHNEYLEVNVELRGTKAKSRTLPKRLLKQITEGLLAKNAEYTYLTHHMPTRVIPKIVLWPHEHPLHFRAGIKQKWIKK
jgi:phenylacetate-CoA ligase